MSETTEDQITWKGASVLRPFLVPISDLEPWPGNPRRGDVAVVRESLHRFGQVRAVLVAADNPRRIVAGHHVVLAASDEGWTEVAVMPNEFDSEEEARAYLLADNRSHDRGDYDLELLHAQLSAVADATTLEGTGYRPDDLDDLMAQLARMQDFGDPDPGGPSPLDPPPSDFREVVLLYAPDQLQQFEAWLGIVRKERGVDGVSETVYAALRVAAEYLNQGT